MYHEECESAKTVFAWLAAKRCPKVAFSNIFGFRKIYARNSYYTSSEVPIQVFHRDQDHTGKTYKAIRVNIFWCTLVARGWGGCRFPTRQPISLITLLEKQPTTNFANHHLLTYYDYVIVSIAYFFMTGFPSLSQHCTCLYKKRISLIANKRAQNVYYNQANNTCTL